MCKPTRTKLAIALVVGVACTLGLLLAGHFLRWRKPLDLDRPADFRTEELIDRLQDEATEGMGTHSTAWAEGFLATDEEPRFRGGILGSAKPAASPVMKELVRRGLAALPELLDHLTDPRPTHLVVKLPFGRFGGMWHSNEYETRSAGDEPPGVNSGDNGERFIADGEYRVRVRDLCYVAVGQIVNRRFVAVRYQPSACIVINSPVETPELAAAVRADWADLTAVEHERSLLRDAREESKSSADAALKRLRFYYPQAAVDFLPRPEEQKR
jgi:hypothetical protein